MLTYPHQILIGSRTGIKKPALWPAARYRYLHLTDYAILLSSQVTLGVLKWLGRRDIAAYAASPLKLSRSKASATAFALPNPSFANAHSMGFLTLSYQNSSDNVTKATFPELAGAEGFEPPNAGTKNQCLTTWPRPIDYSCLYGRGAGTCPKRE